MPLDLNSDSLFLNRLDLEAKADSCSSDKLRLRSEILDSITDVSFADKSENVDEIASLIALWTPGSTPDLGLVEFEELSGFAFLSF